VRGLGRGKSDILRVGLIWVLQGRLAYEAELGASKPSYEASALAVIAITVLGDGIAESQKEVNWRYQRFHSNFDCFRFGSHPVHPSVIER